DPTFPELLERVRQVSLAGFAHQDLPFEKLVLEVNPERSLAHDPIFQVLFVLQNAPSSQVELAGVTVTPAAAPLNGAKFDITLSMTAVPEGLGGLIEYRTDLFDRTTITRLATHLSNLLYAVAERPERRLSELPLLGAGERQAVLVEWNDTGAELGPTLDERLARRFDAQAVALLGEGVERAVSRSVSYGELERAVRHLTADLVRLGVGPGARVGLAATRTPETMVGLLAVLRAGAAYVPLDLSYPAERLAVMLEDSGAAVLLAPAAATLPPFAGRRVPLDGVLAPAGPAPELPPAAARPLDLAYVIYTSGSTGRPKGVAMTRGALANLLAWQEREVLPGAARALQFSALSFDVSFQEIVSTLTTGGTLVLVSEETRRDPEALLAFLSTRHVERLYLPAVALRQLAAVAQAVPESVTLSLQDVVTAGEQLQVSAALAAFLSVLPEQRLPNQYGPSETHVVTAWTLSGDPEAWPALPPIGRPVANTHVYLLDEQLTPVPLGAPGEMFFGGAAVSRGYLDQPERTAERYVPDAWGGEPGARLYRTGDLARYLTSGALEFLGRRDHQVKVRGVRVEPGEIEAALDLHPAVHQAVVTVDGRGDALRLIAFFVPEPTAVVEETAASLRDFLAARLPAAFIPSLFVPLAAFPLTPSGKVDRRALDKLPLPGAVERSAGAAPRGTLEELLAGIWAAVLGCGAVSRDDNFFE
ncbi:MAG TPA: amino acid adenylation domain-containing protein, partial [Thermoanaerobaculia bacterium]